MQRITGHVNLLDGEAARALRIAGRQGCRQHTSLSRSMRHIKVLAKSLVLLRPRENAYTTSDNAMKSSETDIRDC
jgi:hypothetical protein